MKHKGLLDRAKVFISLFVFTISISAIQALSQEQSLDYNKHYQFHISVGVEYQTLSPFATYGSNFNIYEISAIARYPIPTLPVLQPTLKLGIISFDSQDPDDPDTWDHTHYFGALGVLYANRFSKNFEIGAEALAGFSHAVFQKLIPEEGPLGSSNMFLEVGAHICLDPSYNFCIDIHPNIKYLFSLSPMKDFDGLIFGIGFSGHYRFGEDPDAPGAIIRSIRFDDVSFKPVFAAMQSYYTKNPVGKIKITNTEKESIYDIDVLFFQAGYMDTPTPSDSFPELKAGESKDVDLFASFNEEAFTTEGITPLTGEIIVKYKSRGKPAEQSQPVPYDLHDKTSLTWNDDRKVAAFITPADSALRNYSSFIRQSCKEDIVPDYNEKLQIAIQVYHALGELGCIYQADPILPFTKVQEDPMVVDSISLPRDTLKRITGDCDDLTVLYCSLLETVGIETGFITVPGHIYAAFNTEVSTRLYKKIHPEREMTIGVDGNLWVPVEITLIGKEGLLAAWRKGIEEWNLYENNPEQRGFYITRKSQQLYRPVGLKETDLGLQYGSKENIVEDFKHDIGELTDLIVKDYVISAKESQKKEDYNRLGITYARFMEYQKAEDAFRKALEIDPDFLHAQVNLGNLMYLKQDYPAALAAFEKAFTILQAKGEESSSDAVKVLLNISKAHYELKQFSEAKSYFEKAYDINPSRVDKYAYLGKAASDEARASTAVDTKRDVLFLGEEE